MQGRGGWRGDGPKGFRHCGTCGTIVRPMFRCSIRPPLRNNVLVAPLQVVPPLCRCSARGRNPGASLSPYLGVECRGGLETGDRGIERRVTGLPLSADYCGKTKRRAGLNSWLRQIQRAWAGVTMSTWAGVHAARYSTARQSARAPGKVASQQDCSIARYHAGKRVAAA